MWQYIKYRQSLILNLFSNYGKVKYIWFVLFFISVLNYMLTLITPVFYKIFINDVIIQREAQKMSTVLAGYLSILIFQVLLGYADLFLGQRLNNQLLFNIKNKMWKKYLWQSESRSISDMKMRLEDDTKVYVAFSKEQSYQYYMYMLSILLAVAALFYIDWRLTLISISTIPLTLFLDHYFGKKEGKLNGQIRENDQNMVGWLYKSIQGWREIRALNMQGHEEQVLEQYHSKYESLYTKYQKYWVTRFLVIPKIKDDFIMQFCLYFIGGFFILGGSLSIGALFVFVQYYTIMAGSIRSLSVAEADIRSSQPIYDRVMEELKNDAGVVMPVKPVPGGRLQVELRQVGFAYDRTLPPVIKNVSFIIKPGDRIGLIGGSGCGKTTILKLISGLLEVQTGHILFNGLKINDIDSRKLHQRVGFVTQDSRLFHTTIHDNLLFGNENASREEMVEACKKAQIHDFIQGLKQGYDTIIGVNGCTLSGGQKQRLILARVFLQKPDLYLLDESTSALDQRNDNLIQEFIQYIGENAAVILVSHRMSTLSFCSRILKLKDGLIEEVSIRGTETTALKYNSGHEEEPN